MTSPQSLSLPRVFISVAGRSHVSRVNELLSDALLCTPYLVVKVSKQSFLEFCSQTMSESEGDNSTYKLSPSYDSFFHPKLAKFLTEEQYLQEVNSSDTFSFDCSAPVDKLSSYVDSLRTNEQFNYVSIFCRPCVSQHLMKAFSSIEVQTCGDTPYVFHSWFGPIAQCIIDFIACWVYDIYVLRRYTSLIYPVLSSTQSDLLSITKDSNLWDAMSETNGVRFISFPKTLVSPVIDEYCVIFDTLKQQAEADSKQFVDPFVIRPKNATHALFIVQVEDTFYYALTRARTFIARPVFHHVGVGDPQLSLIQPQGGLSDPTAFDDTVISSVTGLSKEAIRAKIAAEKAAMALANPNQDSTPTPNLPGKQQRPALQVTNSTSTDNTIHWNCTYAAQARVSRAYYKLEESFMTIDKNEAYFGPIYRDILKSMESRLANIKDHSYKLTDICAKYGWWSNATGSVNTDSEIYAMDIGAAPGSWTLSLVQRGARTFSIDPGPLSIEHPLITHLPYLGESPICISTVTETIQKLAPKRGTQFGALDIVVCDINARIQEAVQIILKSVVHSNLLRPGAILVLTIKSFNYKTLESSSEDALSKLAPYFKGLKLFWLLTNKKERTIIGIRSDWINEELLTASA